MEPAPSQRTTSVTSSCAIPLIIEQSPVFRRFIGAKKQALYFLTLVSLDIDHFFQ
jgi:hypothetical protein